ncbi:MAG: M20/M25/M40 family metallo-hydrolase [Gemmatimonadetes bacterium]|nr:M20/M25/M40 family metallo-hydrolase [Gemmatimonadota bacterium]
MKRVLWIVVLALTGCTDSAVITRVDAAGDRLADAVSRTTFWAALEFLSDDALEGRAPGTRGGDLAAKYIAAEFRQVGLEPAGDDGTFFHRVPIISLTPDPTLSLLLPGRSARRLRYPEDYVLWSMRDKQVIEARSSVVFVGYGVVAPEYQWDDYAGVDVTGKIVLTLVNDPGFADSTIFRGEELTYYGRWTYKIEEAARQGASGILLVHTTASATYPWATVSGSWTGPQVRLEAPPTELLLAGWLAESIAAELLQPVAPSAEAVLRLAASGSFAPVELPVSMAASVVSVIELSETVNVVGRLTGWGHNPNESVLIGGHYDHLGIGTPVEGDSIYNGAVDNASGTAAVIAAAEAFMTSGVRPDRSILFMAFGAEESGLLGSKAFAARPTLPLRDLAAVINLDEMNLYGSTNDVSALGVNQSSLGDAFTAAARAEKLDVTVNPDAIRKGFFFRSDHFPFVLAGVPALSLQFGQDYVGRDPGWGAQMDAEYGERRYHQPGDELLTWYTLDGATQQLRVMLRTALKVANASDQPTWNEGSEFKAAGDARLQQ